jgi:hypothetical protein
MNTPTSHDDSLLVADLAVIVESMLIYLLVLVYLLAGARAAHGDLWERKVMWEKSLSVRCTYPKG